MLADKINESDYESVFSSIHNYGSASYISGFYTGMKAGARLMLNLTEDAGIVF